MMDDNPMLSIIVPVYQVEMYLPACIDSILAQTFRDFELLLVDDGSPDGCPEICDTAAEKDSRIRVIHQKNRGLSAARNAGLDIARGTWIGFVDSDDTIEPEMYEVLLACAQQNRAQMAVCNYQIINEQGKAETQEWLEKERIRKTEVLSGKGALRIAGKTPMHTAWNKIYRRELWKDHRFPEGKRNEDLFTLPLLYEECPQVVCIPDALYRYSQREGSIMNSKTGLKNYDQAEAAGKYWECLYRNELWQELPQAAVVVWFRTADIYKKISPAERKSARSVQMCKAQYEIFRKTAKVQKVSKALLAKSFLLSRYPQIYLVGGK